MIRHSKILEIPDILNITKACTAYMISKGIYQWNDGYPARDAFLNDLKRNELFVYDTGSGILGVIAVSEKKDKAYEAVSWLTPDGNTVYVHRLAVHPDYQGKGVASKLMDFAEARARELGAVSVRLDTFSQNKRNQNFYEKRGYTQLGSIYFPRQSRHPFHCYELIL